MGMMYLYLILFSCHFNHNKGVNQLKYLDFNIDVKSEGWRSQSQVDISLFSLCWFRCGHGELQPPGTPGYSGYEPRAEWRMGPEQLRWPVVSGPGADLACTPHIAHAAIRPTLSLYFLSRTRERWNWKVNFTTLGHFKLSMSWFLSRVCRMYGSVASRRVLTSHE